MRQIIKAVTLVVLTVSFPHALFAQQIMNLAEGEAKTIKAAHDIASVFIADPSVADYQVIDKQKVVVFGKKLGSTSIIVFDEQGDAMQSRHLIVNKSLIYIQQQIQLNYPNAKVSIANLGDQVVLTGTVASEQEKDDINILTGELLKKSSEDLKFKWQESGEFGRKQEMEFMTRRHFSGLVNNIKVAVTKQVNVKLSIAEVSHSFLEEIGVDYGTNGATSGTFINQLTHFSASDIVSVITAIGDDSVGQILAEPNLSVISGEGASFLVGGELPVVTVVDGTTNVLYKEFGVRLQLMAKVLNDDKIILSLSPEVSTLDTSYTSDNLSLPALKTRRAQTTVELGDGQSFVLAGLLSTQDSESISKIPFISEIPILGALFRHSSTERTKTELIIVATVNLVQPIHTSQIQLPSIAKTTTLRRFFALDTNYKQATERWANEVLATGGFKK